MEHGLAVHDDVVPGQSCAAHQAHGMVGVRNITQFGTDDLVALQVADQTQVQPAVRIHPPLLQRRPMVVDVLEHASGRPSGCRRPEPTAGGQ